MRHWIYTLALLSCIVSMPSFSASKKGDIEKFYKPVTQKDLTVDLPERLDGRFDTGDALFSGNGGCPDEINIGSVTEDTTVIGSTDINVSIDGDIIVQCGSGF